MTMTGTVQSRSPHNQGFTLTELILATFLLSILSVGSLGYQYVATRHVRLAESQAEASRLAKMILDGWKGSGGDAAYNPATLWDATLQITPSPFGPSAADIPGRTVTETGRYRVQIEPVYYFITCSYSPATAAAPRLLNVAVAWRSDYGNGSLDEDAHEVRYSALCNH